MEADAYINTGRSLMRRLANHYHPEAQDPLESVPVVELLAALELAAEDLGRLCRQIPGGDLITLSHWKRAVKVANYIQRANDLYTFLIPILNPVSGLVRLGAREWITKPAWKSMQQNVLRWFYQAYVNRLGVHLIELLSGRLAIGSDQYRRLSRRLGTAGIPARDESVPLRIAVAGAKGSGKSRLIELARSVTQGDLRLVKARMDALGLDAAMLDRLHDVEWVEAPGYALAVQGETKRDRASRIAAIEATVNCDLLILVVNAQKPFHKADVEFAQGWDRWYVERPNHEVPPALVVIAGVDRIEPTESWCPPYNWPQGASRRESAVRNALQSLRASLPPSFTDYIAVGLHDESPFGVIEDLLPSIAAQLHKAERAALIRRLAALSGRSRAGRLMSQIGEHGRSIWKSVRSRRKSGSSNGSN
jgi:hypothetical protein